MSTIEIGRPSAGDPVALPLRLANRHGLVTGATGTGKTVTLQRMVEQFSAAGVPVFAADVKGDLSGIATSADGRRLFPVEFWDLFGHHGLPVRTSVQEMGPQLLSRMLGLNEAQEGAMAICFRKAEDDRAYMLTLDDLRWSLNDMLEEREDVCKRYGNVTAASIAAIQRGLLALEAQGGTHLFGEPPFDILDMIRTLEVSSQGSAGNSTGMGVINLLHADQLMEAPKLYATFLLWLLTELFRRMPEAGDLDKPKLVFFFDEAHLLFAGAPKPLVEKVERLVRLVRSKGVGVYFVTQSPADVPASVLEQLGARVMHAMRAHTAESQRRIRAAADTIRPNPAIKTREQLPILAIGEALVSVIGPNNTPSMVEKVKVGFPQAQVGPVSDLERNAIIEASPLRTKYASEIEVTEASRRFTRRMMLARGIDPGPDVPVEPYTPGLYLQFVPTIDIGAEAGPSTFWALVRIMGWGVVVMAGLKLAGWV